jgi:hypothetical protein
MRRLLLASGLVNALGALLFAPPSHGLRVSFGLPEADAFYLWILSSWVFAFGVAYVYMGWTGRVARGVVALGAWGKATFGLAFLALVVQGRVPATTAAGAGIDLGLAAAFAWWLWTSSSAAPKPNA